MTAIDSVMRTSIHSWEGRAETQTKGSFGYAKYRSHRINPVQWASTPTRLPAFALAGACNPGTIVLLKASDSQTPVW